MSPLEIIIFIFEILGVVAFAISGSLTALKKNMDLFGVVILGEVTAIGGGFMRDLLIGVTPPSTFTDPIYAITGLFTALLTFIIEYWRCEVVHIGKIWAGFADAFVFWFDTIGISIFCMMGVGACFDKSAAYTPYFITFVGTITGVGGGLTCDILAGNIPRLFVKHVYASACIAGSLTAVLLWKPVGRIPAVITGALVIFLMRVLARHFKWNFPKIKHFGDEHMRENMPIAIKDIFHISKCEIYHEKPAEYSVCGEKMCKKNKDMTSDSPSSDNKENLDNQRKDTEDQEKAALQNSSDHSVCAKNSTSAACDAGKKKIIDVNNTIAGDNLPKAY